MVGLIVAGVLLLLAGLVGCVVPAIPGPPLAYLSLILMSFATRWEAYRPRYLVIMGVAAVVVTALDYVLPALTSRRYGASKAGVWGSIIGMLVGMFFAPFGVILGAFLGAFVGEVAYGPDRDNALRAAWGVFVGTMLGVGAKLAYTGVAIYGFVREIPW